MAESWLLMVDTLIYGKESNMIKTREAIQMAVPVHPPLEKGEMLGEIERKIFERHRLR